MLSVCLLNIMGSWGIYTETFNSNRAKLTDNVTHHITTSNNARIKDRREVETHRVKRDTASKTAALESLPLLSRRGSHRKACLASPVLAQ